MREFGISYNEAIQEPNEAIEHGLIILSLMDAARAKLEAGRQS